MQSNDKNPLRSEQLVYWQHISEAYYLLGIRNRILVIEVVAVCRYSFNK